MSKIQPKLKLSDSVIEEIKRMLYSGEINEGDKLPNQNDFADQLGVSRLSLREALHTLQMMGVVEQKPRVGTVIKKGNPDLWSNQLTSPLISDKKGTFEMIEARRVIEIAVSKLAIQNIENIDIPSLENNLQHMIESKRNNDMEQYRIADTEFHTSIAKAADNRYLLHMFISIYKIMDGYMNEFFNVLPASAKDFIRVHKMIIQSLKEKNESKFIHSIKIHLDIAENIMKNYYAAKDQ